MTNVCQTANHGGNWVAIHVAAMRDDAVLLRRQPGGGHALPVGFIEGAAGGDPELAREVLAAAGLDSPTAALQIVATGQRSGEASAEFVDLFFRTESVVGTPTEDYSWWSLGELPPGTAEYVRQALRTPRGELSGLGSPAPGTFDD